MSLITRKNKKRDKKHFRYCRRIHKYLEIIIRLMKIQIEQRAATAIREKDMLVAIRYEQKILRKYHVLSGERK